MEKEKETKFKKSIKDALGRTISRADDQIYFVLIGEPISDVNSFFKNAEKTIGKIGFIKCFLEEPKGSNKTIVKVKIKKDKRLACTSMPKQFSFLNKVVTTEPNDEMSNHEWKTILYCGYCGVFNPSENFVRICDLKSIDYNGIMHKI